MATSLHMRPRVLPPATNQLVTGALVLVAAAAGCLGFALLNRAWFDVANGVVGLRDSVARAALFSAFPLVVGLAVVARDPAGFGLRLGDIGGHWRLVGAVTV